MEKKKEPVVAKKVTAGMATWRFIFFFVLFFALWAAWNVLTPVKFHFDKYPFILFNLFLSFIAAIQGSVIMIFQKYQDAWRDKILARMDRREREDSKRLDSIEAKLDMLIAKEAKK